MEWRIRVLTAPVLVAAHWSFDGRLPSWVPSFPDYDCHRVRPGAGGLDWGALRRIVEDMPAEEWISVLGPEVVRAPLGEALDLLRDEELPACSLGALFMALAHYAVCTHVALPRPCDEEGLLSEVVQRSLRLLLRRSVFEIFVGTRWPILRAFDALHLPQYHGDPELSCEAIEQPVLDWAKLRVAFSPDADWFNAAKPLVYDRGFQASWITGLDECPYGFGMVALWKMVICAETQAECVSQYTALLEDVLQKNDWREIAGSPWRIFGFLARVQHSIRRHDFHIDFWPSEMRWGAPSPLPAWFFGQSSALSAAEADGLVSRSLADALRTVLAGVPRSYIATAHEDAPRANPQDGRAHQTPGTKVRTLLYVAMVFGPRYVPYIPRFVTRAASLGISNLALFCLDDDALAACNVQLGESSGRCIRGTPSILNKFTLPLAFLHLGVDVFWLDFDVFLLQDPTPAVLERARTTGADLLVSGSFADDCICSGLVFFRATPVVADWLLTVLSWMYEHVYTHDQQAFSAFLGYRADEDNATSPERISGSKLFRLYMEPEVPRWALLDPVTEFATARVLNTTGWTGDLSRMVIFHFLHGDSEVNRDHQAYGWNVHSGYANATEQPLLDIFYNQTDERLYTEATAPQELSEPVREALMASRRPSRPKEMLHCGVLQLNEYTPGRMNPDG